MVGQNSLNMHCLTIINPGTVEIVPPIKGFNNRSVSCRDGCCGSRLLTFVDRKLQQFCRWDWFRGSEFSGSTTKEQTSGNGQ